MRKQEPPSGERRAKPRYTTHQKQRLYVHVYLNDVKIEQHRNVNEARLIGYTHDVSEAGLAVILRSHRIAGLSIIGSKRKLRVLLGLPQGPVEVVALAAHCAELEGDEVGYIVGIKIVSMADADRARYLKHLDGLADHDI
jgi:hypothetical protein